jgi:hypothetical protein
MRRVLFGAVLAVLLALVVGASAHATAFTRCGKASAKLTNVQAKHMTCKQAKRFVRAYSERSGQPPGSWHCRTPGQATHRCQAIDTRTHRLKVVKWVEG